MSSGDERKRNPPAGDWIRAWTPVLFAVVGIWLAWQIVLIPVVQRAPPELAIRVAPTSPLALSRVAESEFAAERFDNADFLARARLRQAPFDVRALRVAGLAASRLGRTQQASDLLTLAGNWSLRDDPTHAWLVEERLRRGNYASALAHADTLARRREDIRPQIFNLFTQAALNDRRALPVVVGLLAARPPWSASYFDSLYGSVPGLQLAANLALALEQRGAPLTDEELRRLYYSLSLKVAPEGLSALRARLKRPAAPAELVIDGGFETGAGVEPFAWVLGDQAGLVAEVAPSFDGGNALYVSYEGFGADGLVEQFLTLSPGTYTLYGLQSTDSVAQNPPFAWKLVCVGLGASGVTAFTPVYRAGGRPGWRRFTTRFQVPQTNCAVQSLRLNAPSRDRKREMSAWFDGLGITQPE